MNFADLPRRGDAFPRLQIFVSDLSATGVVRNAIAIANEAAASGFDVRLLTCTAGGVLAGEADRRVTIVELLDKSGKGTSRRSQLKKIFFPYRRHSRAWRPDILLSAGNHGHLLSSFAWLGLPGVKVLRISNDLHHRTRSVPAGLWRTFSFRIMSVLADRLVLVSRAYEEHPLLSRLAAKGKAMVIANGVDVQAVRKASLEPCPHPWAADRTFPFVLAVGRHVKQKNFPVLLEAFALAREQRKMRLIILGGGDASESVRLQNLAVALKISNDISFVPPTANPFPYFAAAHALALPSLWEGSSNALLEALACGTPIIASRTAGDAEQLLAQGKFGELVAPADKEGLAAALLKQVGSNPTRPGNRAMSFDRAVVLKDYMRLFRKCIGTKGPQRRQASPIVATTEIPRTAVRM